MLFAFPIPAGVVNTGSPNFFDTIITHHYRHIHLFTIFMFCHLRLFTQGTIADVRQADHIPDNDWSFDLSETPWLPFTYDEEQTRATSWPEIPETF